MVNGDKDFHFPSVVPWTDAGTVGATIIIIITILLLLIRQFINLRNMSESLQGRLLLFIIIIIFFFLRPLAQSRRLKIKQLWLDMALTQI